MSAAHQEGSSLTAWTHEEGEMVKLINKLYHEEHKHKIGEKTVGRWRTTLNGDNNTPRHTGRDKGQARWDTEQARPASRQQTVEAANYFNNRMEAVVDIFKRGDTALDNNLVERMNRYFSMSRRSSLFFGSHKGAERAAMLYTLALSAKMNHLNLFDYLADIPTAGTAHGNLAAIGEIQESIT